MSFFGLFQKAPDESWREIKDPPRKEYEIGDVIQTGPGESIKLVKDNSWLGRGSYIGLKRNGGTRGTVIQAGK